MSGRGRPLIRYQKSSDLSLVRRSEKGLEVLKAEDMTKIKENLKMKRNCSNQPTIGNKNPGMPCIASAPYDNLNKKSLHYAHYTTFYSSPFSPNIH